MPRSIGNCSSKNSYSDKLTSKRIVSRLRKFITTRLLPNYQLGRSNWLTLLAWIFGVSIWAKTGTLIPWAIFTAV